MTCSTELAPKKEGNCNVMATWPRHVISLVIISNNIPLSPPIHLFIALFLMAHLFNTLNSIHLLLGIGFLTLHCWKAYQPLFHLLGSAPTIILSLSHLLRNDIPWFDSIGDLDLFLYLYNCKPMTWSSYRSTPARSVASHKALEIWSCHADGESTT